MAIERVYCLDESNLQSFASEIIQKTELQIDKRIVSELNDAITDNNAVSAVLVKSLVDELTAKDTALESTFNDVEAEVTGNISNSLSDLTDRIGDAESSISNLITAYGTIESNISTVSSGLTSTNTAVSELGDQINDLTHMTIETVIGNIEDVAEPVKNVLYFQKDNEEDITWELFVWHEHVNADESHWINVGNTAVDLANYWSLDDVDEIKEAIDMAEIVAYTSDEIVDMVEAQWSAYRALIGDDNKLYYFDPTAMVGGLYDENGLMLCAWEDTGIDVSKNYARCAFTTDESHLVYVVNNVYPQTRTIVIPETERVFGDYSLFGLQFDLSKVTLPITDEQTNFIKNGNLMYTYKRMNAIYSLAKEIDYMGDRAFIGLSLQMDKLIFAASKVKSYFMETPSWSVLIADVERIKMSVLPYAENFKISNEEERNVISRGDYYHCKYEGAEKEYFTPDLYLRSDDIAPYNEHFGVVQSYNIHYNTKMLSEISLADDFNLRNVDEDGTLSTELNSLDNPYLISSMKFDEEDYHHSVAFSPVFPSVLMDKTFEPLTMEYTLTSPDTNGRNVIGTTVDESVDSKKHAIYRGAVKDEFYAMFPISDSTTGYYYPRMQGMNVHEFKLNVSLKNTAGEEIWKRMRYIPSYIKIDTIDIACPNQGISKVGFELENMINLDNVGDDGYITLEVPFLHKNSIKAKYIVMNEFSHNGYYYDLGTSTKHDTRIPDNYEFVNNFTGSSGDVYSPTNGLTGDDGRVIIKFKYTGDSDVSFIERIPVYMNHFTNDNKIYFCTLQLWVQKGVTEENLVEHCFEWNNDEYRGYYLSLTQYGKTRRKITLPYRESIEFSKYGNKATKATLHFHYNIWTVPGDNGSYTRIDPDYPIRISEAGGPTLHAAIFESVYLEELEFATGCPIDVFIFGRSTHNVSHSLASLKSIKTTNVYDYDDTIISYSGEVENYDQSAISAPFSGSICLKSIEGNFKARGSLLGNCYCLEDVQFGSIEYLNTGVSTRDIFYSTESGGFSGNNNIKRFCYGGSQEEWAALRKNVQFPNATDIRWNYKGGTLHDSSSNVREASWLDVEDNGFDISRDITVEEYDANGEGLFKNWLPANYPNATVLTTPSDVEHIGDRACYNTTQIKEINLTNVKSIGNYGLRGMSNLESITFGRDLDYIGTKAFDCTGMSSESEFELNINVHYVADRAFEEMYTLTKATLTCCESDADYPASIMEGAFNVCSALKDVSLLGYETIDKSVFRGCTALTNVSLDKELKSIGVHAFGDCTALEHVFFGGTEEEWNAISIADENEPLLNARIHYNCDFVGGLYDADGVQLCTYAQMKDKYIDLEQDIEIAMSLNDDTDVSMTSLFEYVTDSYWSNHIYNLWPTASKLVIPVGVTRIGSCKFATNEPTNEGQNILTSIKFPCTLRYIGDHAFYNQKNITNVEFADEVYNELTIGGAAFTYLSNLESIKFPEGLISIPSSTFSGCTNLSTVDIPSTVEHIGAHAFNKCAITNIELPNNLTIIEHDAFGQWYSLCDVYYEGTARQFETQLINNGGLDQRGNDYLMKAKFHTIDEDGNTVDHDCIYEIMTPGLYSAYGEYIGPFDEDLETLTADIVTEAHNRTPDLAFNKVILPSSLKKIDRECFKDNTNISIVYLKKDYEIIPNPISCQIGEYAFAGCTALKYILNDDKITNICDNAFDGCTSLRSIDLRNISNYCLSTTRTFAGCESLEEIIMPERCMNIYDEYAYTEKMYEMFKGCIRLQSVVIPPTAHTIGTSAFEGCTALKNVYVPKLTDKIRESAFTGCPSSMNIIYEGTEEQWNRINGHEYVTCNLITEYGQLQTVPGLYDDNDNLLISYDELVSVVGHDIETDYVAADMVIYQQSLKNPLLYPDITEEDLDGVKRYEYLSPLAYYLNKNYQNGVKMILPTSLSLIGSMMFAGCKHLTTVVKFNSFDSINVFAFSNCPVLSNFYSSLESYLTGINYIDSNFIGTSAFYNADMSGHTIVQYRNIGTYTFDNNKNMEYVTFEKWTMSSVVTRSMFTNNDGLKEVCIATDSIDTIRDTAFFNCYSLEYIYMPGTITTIEESAFSGCTSLKEVYFAGSAEDWCNVSINETGNSALDNVDVYVWDDDIEDWVLYHEYEYEAVSLYDENDNLLYTMYTTERSNVTIGNEMYELCNTTYPDTRKVVIHDIVTSIDDFAFQDCISLTSINIPNSVTSIGTCAFKFCERLTSIIIPDSVTNISGGIFHDCRLLTAVFIPISVANIGNGAFNAGCSLLTDVYYSGSESDWNNITIGSTNNHALESSTVHYNCKLYDRVSALDVVMYNNDESRGNTAANTADTPYLCTDFTSANTPIEFKYELPTIIDYNCNVLSVDDVVPKCKRMQYDISMKPYNRLDVKSHDTSTAIISTESTERLRNLEDGLYLAHMDLTLNYSNNEQSNFYVPLSIDIRRVMWWDGEEFTNNVNHNAPINLEPDPDGMSQWIFMQSTSGYNIVDIQVVEDLVADINDFTVSTMCIGSPEPIFVVRYNGTKRNFRSALKVLITFDPSYEEDESTYVSFYSYLHYYIGNVQSSDVDPLSYITYDDSDDTVIITGTTMAGRYAKSLYIPYKINDKFVTTIGKFAFATLPYLEEVHIPKSVTIIDKRGFDKSHLLKAVYVISDSEYDSQFDDDTVYLYNSAFQGCISLTEFGLANYASTYKSECLYNCFSLNYFDVALSVTHIDYKVIRNCVNINLIRYEGNKSDWDKIYIDDDNEKLLSLPISYNDPIFNQ